MSVRHPLIVLLSGSVVIGCTAAVALHELGHAVTNIALGGSVRRITLHPFSWSYTYYGAVPHPELATWGGAVFSTVVGWIMIALLWRSRRIAALPVFLVGIIAGMLNGVYLAVDSLMRAGGDGTSLLDYGTPLWVLVTLGVVLAGIAIACMIARIELLGFKASDRVVDRVIMSLGASAPFLLAMLAYHWLFNHEEIWLWLTYAGVGVLAAVVVAVGSGFVKSRHKSPVAQPGWRTAASTFGAAAAIVAIELLWLAR